MKIPEGARALALGEQQQHNSPMQPTGPAGMITYHEVGTVPAQRLMGPTLFRRNVMNSIANLKTVNAQSPDGPVPVIVMGLNIGDETQADEFVREVAERFKAQRMCSPPTTAAMLITIMSAMPLSRFVDRWNELAREDKILRFFMSQMRKADVLRGTTAGVTLEQASLVTPAG